MVTAQMVRDHKILLYLTSCIQLATLLFLLSLAVKLISRQDEEPLNYFGSKSFILVSYFCLCSLGAPHFRYLCSGVFFVVAVVVLVFFDTHTCAYIVGMTSYNRSGLLLLHELLTRFTSVYRSWKSECTERRRNISSSPFPLRGPFVTRYSVLAPPRFNLTLSSSFPIQAWRNVYQSDTPKIEQ